MTPQLQQAIRLLQLSTLELRTEIQEALDSNLMLEVAEEAESEAGAEAGETGADSTSPETGDNDLDLQQSDIPDDLPVDTAWDDIYDNVAPASYSGPDEGASSDYETQSDSSETLQDHLHWQMQMSHFSDTDLTIADAIIDSIDEDGYLTTSVEDIQRSLAQGEDSDIELDEVEAVLHRIQNFDPPGVGARGLRECLQLQLRQLPEDVALLNTARELIADHFDLLAGRDYAQIMRRMKIDEETLKQAIKIVQSLNPRPGNQIAEATTEYVVPDIIVRKVKGTWRVELNPDAAPRLRINSHYASLIKQAHNNSDTTYLKNHLQEARWFIKSLQSRNETLLKVATSIVKHQRDFLEHGEEAMKALVLHDIAEEVGMHESTISRVTTNKYMHTPRGIFELKYFFSSHVSTASGGECSATAIRAFIKKLIAAEEPSKPLSDSKIASILSEQGINVARRTVAKYREGLAIPPSNERKRLA